VGAGSGEVRARNHTRWCALAVVVLTTTCGRHSDPPRATGQSPASALPATAAPRQEEARRLVSLDPSRANPASLRGDQTGWIKERLTVGRVVLVARGSAVGAIRMTRQSSSPWHAEYEWALCDRDGGGFAVDATRGTGSVVLDVDHGSALMFGPFEVPWAPTDPPGSGTVGYSKDQQTAICVTDLETFDGVDPRDRRFVYCRFHDDPGAVFVRDGAELAALPRLVREPGGAESDGPRRAPSGSFRTLRPDVREGELVFCYGNGVFGGLVFTKFDRATSSAEFEWRLRRDGSGLLVDASPDVRTGRGTVREQGKGPPVRFGPFTMAWDPWDSGHVSVECEDESGFAPFYVAVTGHSGFDGVDARSEQWLYLHFDGDRGSKFRRP